MKAHHRSKKASGGAESGSREWEADIESNPEERNNAKKIFGEAKEKKHGGRAARKHGGKIHGEHAMHHAGRKPRKSGGRASDMNPLSSAHKGTAPKGHHDVEMD